MCVLTGGEPGLQVDKPLIDALHAEGFYICIETNGTRPLPEGIDWITCSPKESSITNHKSQITNHKTLLHVSCFDERAKNVKGLLRAAKMLSEKRQDWRLVLVGTGVDYEEVRAYADTLAIPDGLLRWTGELTPREVADEMQRADALVLSSRYETYGVVLAEAVAAGLPILSTPVGIAEEVADLIVPQEIAQHKAGTFAEFLETILFRVESRKSKVESERFTSEAVGKTLKEAYDSCLHRDI
jgi:glycosyltransferase involved in cell wall biosynthesis